MSSPPVLQHWLVPVARGAELLPGDGVDVPADLELAEAWRRVAEAAGITQDALADHVARHFRLERADLAGADAHAHRLVPARMARRLHVLPLRYTDRAIDVATADPVSMETEREVSHVSSRTVRCEVAPPDALEAALARAYGDETGAPASAPLAPEQRGGPQVLVVDDEPETRLLLRRVLEDRGFRVREADDGERALELLEADETFHLVTLDLMMPGMDGFEVLRRIRARVRTAALPVIVATAKDDPEVEVRLFEAGADDFVVKPIDAPRFILRIQAVLRRRRPGAGLGP